MKLVDLSPKWAADQDGKRYGLSFQCPVCKGEGRLAPDFCSGMSIVPTAPEQPKGWQRNGETFATLTLTPSINVMGGGCKWHGFITAGEVTFI